MARRDVNTRLQREQIGEPAKKLRGFLDATMHRTRANHKAKSALRVAVSTPSALRRYYLRTLAPAHMLCHDRQVEKLLFKPTELRDRSRQLDEHNAQDVYQGPIPGQVLDWVIGNLDITLREFVFVDFSAGNARTMIYAAMHDFDRVIGFEYNQEMHEDALLNISQFPRTLMKCRDVECRRGDQGDIAIPEQPLVLFFPRAARQRFMSLILDHVAASYRANPRRIFLIFENFSEFELSDDQIFSRIKMPVSARLKLKMFSPVRISVYRSIA